MPPKIAAALVLAGFVGLHFSELGSLQHNIDEGVNVYAARLMQQGQAPFRDFFYQQPPLYLSLLSVLPTDHFIYGRWVSLLAAAATGWLVFVAARRIFGSSSWASPLALVLYCSAGLQYYNLLAMPGACMLLFGSLAVLLISWQPQADSKNTTRHGDVTAAAAGVCLCLAILFKAVALSLLPAVVLALASVPGQRRRIVPLALGGTVVGLAAWGAWHLSTEGTFTQLLWMQGARILQRGVLDGLREVPVLGGLVGEATVFGFTDRHHLRELPGFRDALSGVSELGLTWRLYRSAFGNLLSDVIHLDTLLALAGVSGVWTLWRHRQTTARLDKLIWSGWILFPLLFSFFVWDVAWEHYHVLYLPPLALLAAVWIQRFAARSRLTFGVSALLCVAFIAAGLISTHLRHRDYAPVLALRGATTPLLAFDPTVNVLSETVAGCGATHFQLTAAMRVEGLPVGLLPSGQPFEFNETRDHIIACLEASPETRIVLHLLSNTSLALIDAPFYDYIMRQQPERLIYLPAETKEFFQSYRAPAGR